MAKKISKGRLWAFRLIAVVLAIAVPLFIVDKLVVAPQAVGESADTISINELLMEKNRAIAEQNPYGFTDEPPVIEKKPGHFRIAVLGDSFIWGDGVEIADVWSHKLEAKIHEEYDSIDMMHWGRNGWQTLQEYNFYDTAGYKYEPDLLILGYVDNDPDMGRFEHMDPMFRENYKLLYKLFPRLSSEVFHKLYSKSYAKWQARLHAEENMTMYSELLKKFKARLNSDSVPHFYVLTPACIYMCHTYYEAVKPTLDSTGFDYVDTYYEVDKRLSHLPYDSIRSNPSNYHPGFRMTQVFAEVAYEYIQENGLIPDSLRKVAAPIDSALVN